MVPWLLDPSAGAASTYAVVVVVDVVGVVVGEALCEVVVVARRDVVLVELVVVVVVGRVVVERAVDIPVVGGIGAGVVENWTVVVVGSVKLVESLVEGLVVALV